MLHMQFAQSADHPIANASLEHKSDTLHFKNAKPECHTGQVADPCAQVDNECYCHMTMQCPKRVKVLRVFLLKR
jgi:hypothetical protein